VVVLCHSGIFADRRTQRRYIRFGQEMGQSWRPGIKFSQSALSEDGGYREGHNRFGTIGSDDGQGSQRRLG
jgi:hypothetical protein